jgi:hypothetical protein
MGAAMNRHDSQYSAAFDLVLEIAASLVLSAVLWLLVLGVLL